MGINNKIAVITIQRIVVVIVATITTLVCSNIFPIIGISVIHTEVIFAAT